MKDLALELTRLEDVGLLRTLRDGGTGPEIRRDDRVLINLASNDSLGLANDPQVISALTQGAMRHGVGASASRLVSGHHDVHAELENRIAQVRDTEAALVFSSGYAANVGVLSALCGRHDTVFADELIHASLLDGIRLSGARLVRHQHLDIDHLRESLAADRERATGSGHRWVVTEGIFSMDADLPDLPAMADLASEFDATLIVDDAHGFGVMGPQGHGSITAAGAAVPVQLGTLSKAVGAQGGFVAGDATLISYLVNHARSFIFSTGLSPAVAAAASQGVERLHEDEWRRTQLRSHVAALRQALTASGLQAIGDPIAPMIPVVVQDAETAVRLSAALADLGLLVPAIRPPAVPTSRLRFSPMATHTPDQIGLACRAIEQVAR